jgi:hypothetical protein
MLAFNSLNFLQAFQFIRPSGEAERSPAKINRLFTLESLQKGA